MLPTDFPKDLPVFSNDLVPTNNAAPICLKPAGLKDFAVPAAVTTMVMR